MDKYLMSEAAYKNGYNKALEEVKKLIDQHLGTINLELLNAIDNLKK